MEYKTPMIAKKLGISSKVVLRVVQAMNLDVKKNKFGHYIFSEEDVQKIKEYYESSHSAQTVPTPLEEDNAPASADIFASFQRQLENLSFRMRQNEEKLQEKAGNVVNYQLLQHRKEIEELQHYVKLLQARVEELEERKSPLSAGLPHEPVQSKRRKLNFSIFGL